MKLSAHFSLSEFTKSQTATRRGLDNTPAGEHLWNIKSLCEQVLEKVRVALGPTIINSGYRGEQLNKAVGGSTKSQHCKGLAADIEVLGVSTFDLATWIRDNCDFDQLILEFHDPADPNSGWVHVSYVSSKDNRKSVLTATKVAGKTQYTVGIGE